MENLNAIMSVTLGVILRLAIPIAITLLAVIGLKRLDQYWQAHAGSNPTLAIVKPKNTGCWDVKHCSAEDKAKCNAYAHPETPCWQVKRNKQGQLSEACVGCQVFHAAVPVTIQL